MIHSLTNFFFFFFNDTATTEIYTLSLHDALPISEAIHKRWPEMRVLHLPNYDHLAKELPDTDIFVGYSLRPQQLKEARKLKWIHSTAAGVAQLMYPELRDSGIIVTNPSGIFSVPMSEHTFVFLLGLARNFT